MGPMTLPVNNTKGFQGAPLILNSVSEETVIINYDPPHGLNGV